MSEVRVLVGTRKGAFILTADGKRARWEVSGPHFAGWEIYHLKGSPVDPNRHLRVAVQRLVRADHPALRRRRQDVAPAGHARRRADHHARRHAQGREQQVRLRHVAPDRQAAHHAPVVRRHAAPVGVQARLAPRAVADRSGHRLRGRRGRRAVPLDRRRQDLARAGRPARPRHGVDSGRRAPAGWACTRSCSTRAIPSASSSPSRRPARSAPTTAGQTWKPINRGLNSQYIPEPDGRGRPLRPPHRDAPLAPEPRCSCRSTGT